MPRTCRALLLLLPLLLLPAGCTFNLFSEEEEIAIGQQLYGPSIQQQLGAFNDPALQNYVQEVGRRLTLQGERPKLPYQFTVLNDPEVNAWALPGGCIAINRGLLELMQNEGQMAAVLGHEVGHVTRKHGVQAQSWQLLGNLLLGGAALVLEQAEVKGSEYIIAAGFLGETLALLAYSRANEREADEAGQLYLAKCGYDPAAFVQSMQLLYDPREGEPWLFETMLRTHPWTPDRMEAARRRLPEMNAVARQAREGQAPVVNQKEFLAAMRPLQDLQPAFRAFDGGVALQRQSRHEEAFGLFQQAIQEARRVGREQPYFFAFAAQELANWQGPSENALRLADRAVLLDPNQYHSRLVRGRLLLGLGEARRAPARLQQAEAEFTVANRLLPDSRPVLLGLGRVNDLLGRRDQAVNFYQAVVERCGGADQAGGVEEGRIALERLQRLRR